VKVLIAEDDAVSRRLLEVHLKGWGFEVISASDGHQAWSILREDSRPSLAILDWMMPGMDGVEVCRLVRERADGAPVHLMLLTSRTTTDDLVAAFQAGADDYLTKPFNQAELKARLRVGERMVRLQSELRDRVLELEDALASVKQLQGLIPICSYCKKIRDDQAFWHRVENYIERRTDAQFSHGVCPDCYESILKPQIEAP